ncbi:GPI-anchored surface protein, putative [Bodo saltans]|uniref:GPI-anchored surface protein, putative n=1 Tax=Bodo saltans TaxID=75058 RepID=A0A0S4JMA6_BODSA|nr:GPI-anchored surface protein, putative [Bodo saltans]|eukprot:CUG92643.1 GPI-anchored surface protein, putative [Bodo saltans]
MCCVTASLARARRCNRKGFFVRECMYLRVFLFSFYFFCLCCPATYPPSPSLLGRFVPPLYLLVFISVVAFSRAAMSPTTPPRKKGGLFPQVAHSCAVVAVGLLNMKLDKCV